MNPDDFDTLLRKGDPGVAVDVDAERADWKRLRSHRVDSRRRWFRFATAAAVLLALGLSWQTFNRDREPARITDRRGEERVPEPREQPRPEIPTPELAANEGASTKGESTTPSAPEKATEPIEAFAMFVKKAISKEDNAWSRSVIELRTAHAATQREAIELVPRLEDLFLRERAMDLVCQAAEDSNRDVLRHWLSKPWTRQSAWARLVQEGNFEQCVALTGLARDMDERERLCQKFAGTNDPRLLDTLTRLAMQPPWRIAMRRGLDSLEPQLVRALTMRMRSRDRNEQVASAFILASLRDDTVERVTSSMILGGRYRHPAYLALLSRNTPESQAFLRNASARRDLSPALVSARHHFSVFEGHLKQWLLDTNGEPDEPQTKQDRTGRALLALNAHFDDRTSLGAI